MLYGIGFSADDIIDLAELETPVPYPKSEPPYADTVECGDGQLHEIGAEYTVWIFSFLEPEQRAMLKTFCPGPSATVYISTRLADDTFGIRRSIMIWPKEPSRNGGLRNNFEIEHRRMMEVNESS